MATKRMNRSRDLRDRTAEVLRRVEAGEEVEILHDSRRGAKLVPLGTRARRRWIPASEILAQLDALGPDGTGCADEIPNPLSDTTHDLRGWPRRH